MGEQMRYWKKLKFQGSIIGNDSIITQDFLRIQENYVIMTLHNELKEQQNIVGNRKDKKVVAHYNSFKNVLS